MTYIGIGKVCDLLGISLSTAYRWIKNGTLTESFRTEGRHRRFHLNTIRQRIEIPEKRKTILYARVSSHDQKKDLITQENRLLSYAKDHLLENVQLISDLGSGLNYKKPGLKQLMTLILTHQVETLILNHKDRLLRFGSDLVFQLCDFYHVKVVILEEKTLSFEETLTHDVIELMTVFCAKLYGKRSHRNKKMVNIPLT